MKGKPSPIVPPGLAPGLRLTIGLLSTGLALSAGWFAVRADQVEMQNGDRYVGKVLSLNTNTLLLQSELLGTVRLSRAQVASISFLPESGPGATDSIRGRSLTNVPAPAPSASHKTDAGLLAALRKLGGDTNSLQQVQQDLLNNAGPDANKKFNELLGGFLTGRLSVGDIRAQAKSAADQVRELKRDLGEDAGFALDGYLAILDKFLKETAPPRALATNAPAAKPSPKAAE